MMKDLLYQVKEGISRTLLFELTNLSEVEALPFDGQNKWFTHSSGLFRRSPQLEPRLPAVVMASFLDVTGRSASFKKELSLSADAEAAELSTAKGDVLVIWSDKGSFAVDQIKAIATSDSVLTDWEGKVVPILRTEELEGRKLYYLSRPDSKRIGAMAQTVVLTAANSVTRSSSLSPNATFTEGKLFTDTESQSSIPHQNWIQSDWKLNKIRSDASAGGFSARAAVGIHPEGLDVFVEVHDKTHVQRESQPTWWQGDSLQIGIDSEGKGFAGGSSEFLSALSSKGPIVWKISAADPHGDIPANWSSANGIAKYVQQHITREGEVTRYQIRIPWSELYPLSFDPGKPLHISFVVNNNDGDGRKEYLEWGRGIAQEKDPSEYGILRKAADH
jgi:hypothetical protein